MRYKYAPDPGVEIGRPTVRGRPIVTGNDFERLGCGVFRVETRHGRIRNERSDRLYLVLEGQGRFTVDGDGFDVAAGDVVLVPRGTTYDYEGGMRLFLVHAPANRDEADLSLEEPPVIGTPPVPPDRVLG